MSKTITETKNIQAVGPYSLARQVNRTLYCSGQIPIDKDKNIIGKTAPEQFKKAMENVHELLEKAGYSIDDVVKVTLLLDDINDFSKVNEVYAEEFSEPFPARSTYEVANLPLGVKVEIEVIACK